MPKQSSKDPIVILFNYGGGMRGLVPAHIMTRIEEVTGLRMADMVDVFAGPSTGSILNAALNIPHRKDPTRPKYRAKHMVRFYEREGLKIFPPDRFRDFRGFLHDFNNRTMKIGQLQSLFSHGHYSPAHLSKCLHALYGEAKLSDSLRSLIIPLYNLDGDQLRTCEDGEEDVHCVVKADNSFVGEGGHAVWLKNMQLPHNPRPTPDVRIHDAVMGSTSAPTYFPCHHFPVTYPDLNRTIEYSAIDGSIFDNPCTSYYGAIRPHLPPDQPVIMILMGTGYTHRSIKKDDWNRYGGLGVVDPVNDLPLINILFHASETAMIESFSQELGDNLHIMNKSLISEIGKPDTPNLDIDDASPVNLKKLERFAHAMIEDNEKRFDDICHILVQNRDNKTSMRRKKKGLFDIFK